MESNVFEKSHRINFYNSDVNSNIKLSSFLAWSGEIAGLHLDSRGITREDMLENEQVFLLTRVSVHFIESAKYRDSCLMKTWEQCVKGVQFYRCFQLSDKFGKPLIDSISSWVLVNPKTHQILRSSDYKYEHPFSDKKTTAEMKKLSLNNFAKTAEHKVLFTELDGNGHMNNTVYADIALNYAPFQFVGKELETVHLSFVGEAKLDEKISIFVNVIDEKCYQMYGEFDNGKRSFDAEIKIR